MQYVVSKVNNNVVRIRNGENILNFEKQWCEVFTSHNHLPWEVYEVSKEEFEELFKEIKEANKRFAFEHGIGLANRGN